MYDSAGGYTGNFYRLFTDNEEEKVDDQLLLTGRYPVYYEGMK